MKNKTVTLIGIALIFISMTCLVNATNNGLVVPTYYKVHIGDSKTYAYKLNFMPWNFTLGDLNDNKSSPILITNKTTITYTLCDVNNDTRNVKAYYTIDNTIDNKTSNCVNANMFFENQFFVNEIVRTILSNRSEYTTITTPNEDTYLNGNNYTVFWPTGVLQDGHNMLTSNKETWSEDISTGWYLKYELNMTYVNGTNRDIELVQLNNGSSSPGFDSQLVVVSLILSSVLILIYRKKIKK